MPMLTKVRTRFHQEFGFYFGFTDVQRQHGELCREKMRRGKPLIDPLDKWSQEHKLEHNFAVVAVTVSNPLDSGARIFVEEEGEALPLAGITLSTLLVSGRKVVLDKPHGMALGKTLRVRVEICDIVPEEMVVTVGGVYITVQDWG